MNDYLRERGFLDDGPKREKKSKKKSKKKEAKIKEKEVPPVFVLEQKTPLSNLPFENDFQPIKRNFQ